MTQLLSRLSEYTRTVWVYFLYWAPHQKDLSITIHTSGTNWEDEITFPLKCPNPNQKLFLGVYFKNGLVNDHTRKNIIHSFNIAGIKHILLFKGLETILHMFIFTHVDYS